MSNNRLDDIFKDGLKDAKITPPDHVWARIQASGVVQPAQNRAIISITTIRWAAAAVIALLMTVGGFWIFQKESTTSGNLPIALEKVAPAEQNTVKNDQSPAAIQFEKVVEETDHVAETETRDIKENIPVGLNTNSKSFPGKDIKSQNRNAIPKRSVLPEHMPLHQQEEEVRIAEVEMIKPTQNLDLTEPKMIPSKDPVSNSELASVDATASKDVAVKFSIDPNALIYAADQLGSERTMREKLFDKAGEKMTELAEAAGLPVRKWSKIKEVEILY